MIHNIKTVEDDEGRTYVSEVGFDIAEPLENFYGKMKGYGGKSFKSLVKSREIEYCGEGGGCCTGTLPWIRFSRPLSLNRFLLMFGRVKKKAFEDLVEFDVEGVSPENKKKYVH